MKTELGIVLQATGPEVTADEVDALCRHLGERGWVRARVLAEELKVSDRHLRVCAEHSDGRIISGYSRRASFGR